MWHSLWSLDAADTAQQARRENPHRIPADAMLLSASIASLIAVGLVLVRAGHSNGLSKALLVSLSIATIVLAWSVVHTVYSLRYANLYYTGTAGGVDFNAENAPCYIDFAYLALTIGMTFQVSDTNLKTTNIRRTALRHALLSYTFGTLIIATTINLAQVLGGRESGDLADLSDDQHRGVGTDPAQLAEQLDPLVGSGALVDLPGGLGDLAVEVVDQRHQTVQPPARPVGQHQLSQVAAPRGAEQVGVLRQNPLTGQQGVHPVLDRGAQVHERRAVAQQVAQVTQLRRGDVGLREQAGAEQMRERPGVDRVGFTRAAAIARVRSGCARCRSNPASLSVCASHSQP
jgi:uncharacterized membrane protein